MATSGRHVKHFAAQPPDFRFLAILQAAAWLALPCLVRGQSAAYDPPASYYANAAGKTGAALETALHNLIAPHTVLSYTPGVWDTLEVLDADPANAANVFLVYSGVSSPIANEYHGGSTTVGTWDREHLFCQSYFAYDTKIVSDVFNLRPIDYAVNGTRGNLYYDLTGTPASTLSAAPGSSYDSDSWEPRDADKGTIARSVLYMAVCYDGTTGSVTTTKLTLSDTPNVSTSTFGKLSTLLAWNRQYPVTDTERKRNQLIYSTYQKNRNPFVDNRYWADVVFGVAASPQAAWLRTKFTAAELATGALTGDLASPASDGIGNLLKYAFNLDPKTSGVGGLPVAGTITRNNVAYLTLSHRLNRQAGDITVKYQGSTNLTTWTDVSPTILSAAAHVDADATDQVTVGVPVSGGLRFLRVVVSK